MQYQFEIARKRQRVAIRHIVLTLFRLGIGLSL